jgi:hypothetical protein
LAVAGFACLEWRGANGTPSVGKEFDREEESMKYGRMVPVVVCLLVAAIVLAACPPTYATWAGYFPLKVGNHWRVKGTYKVWKNGVLRSTKAVDRTTTITATKSWLGLTWRYLKEASAYTSGGHTDRETSYWYYRWGSTALVWGRQYWPSSGNVVLLASPYCPILRNGMVKGKTYSWRTNWTSREGTRTVKGYAIVRLRWNSTENVRVPAGTFRSCLKIYSVHEVHTTGSSAVETESSYTWFAKGVGIVKESTTDRHTEGSVKFVEQEVLQLVSYKIY